MSVNYRKNERGKFKGLAYIVFDDPEMARAALSYHNKVFDGRSIRVTRCAFQVVDWQIKSSISDYRLQRRSRS